MPTRLPVAVTLLLLALPAPALAQVGASDSALIRNALSAAPPALAAIATVATADGRVLKQGTSDWVCMPDDPAVPNDSPMCVDAAWREVVGALADRREPNFSGIGISYMLRRDLPVSNVDPFAAGPTEDNEWLEDAGPHIMIVVSDTKLLDGLPTDPRNGGPWVMWKGTPYAHIMIPTVGREP